MGKIHNFERGLERANVLLENAKISTSDKRLIERFVQYQAAQGIGKGRLITYTGTLRLIAERHLQGKGYQGLVRDDLIEIVAGIEGSKLGDWGKYGYKTVLKSFYEWQGKHELISWMRIRRKPKSSKLPESMPREQEVMQMINAAYTSRDEAAIATLYEGGFRVGEFGGLNIGDITFDRYGAIAIVDGKTGMRRVRLIFAMPYIAKWLEEHPLRDDPRAPLWIKLDGSGERMLYSAIYRQLKRIGERAGVHKRVNPHNFRHARSTHLASKLTESQMEEYLGWVQGSNMPSIYVHMSGRDLDADLLKMYGMAPEEEDQKEELTTLQCPHCKALNTVGARICINCRKPLAVEEVMDLEEKTMKMFQNFMELFEQHPEAMEQFKKISKPKND